VGKKKNSKYRAQRAMWAGATATVFGLLILPLALKDMPLTYSENTGFVGDTIGGIAGPILNFTGLVVVYYSLREQFKANQQQARQIKGEMKRARNERYFDLTFRLVEKLEAATEKHATMFSEVAILYMKQQNPTEFKISEVGKGYEIPEAEKLRGYLRAFWDLKEYFNLIKSQIESSKKDELSGKQKQVLADLIDVSYGRRLADSRIAFQQQYNIRSEEDENATDWRPDILKDIDEQRVEIQEMQKAAKAQIATETIPYGKAETIGTN